jgi:probable HAF family extracellular repeat protein
LAYFWDGGSMYPCGHLGGGTSEATDINDLDQVVGNSTTDSGATHAFVWQLNSSGQGVMTDLGTLGGTNSYATAINNNGLIVGYSETGEIYSQGGITQPIVHACAWYGNVIYDLGIHNDFYNYPFIESYPFSEAIDVNDDNRIAGNSYTINQHYRGFVLDPDPSLVP